MSRPKKPTPRTAAIMRLLNCRASLANRLARLVEVDEPNRILDASHAAQKERSKVFREAILLDVERRKLVEILSQPIEGRNRVERMAAKRRRAPQRERVEYCVREIARLEARRSQLTVEISTFPQRIIDARVQSAAAIEAAQTKFERAKRHLADAEAACRTLGIDPKTVTAESLQSVRKPQQLRLLRATAVA